MAISLIGTYPGGRGAAAPREDPPAVVAGNFDGQTWYDFRAATEPPRYCRITVTHQAAGHTALGADGPYLAEGWNVMRKYYGKDEQITEADWTILTHGMPGYSVDLEADMLQIKGRYPGGDEQSARLLAHLVLGVGFES